MMVFDYMCDCVIRGLFISGAIQFQTRSNLKNFVSQAPTVLTAVSMIENQQYLFCFLI